MSDAPHPFTIPDFRLYWLARFMAVVATMGMVVIIGWQAYDIARTDYGMSPKEAAFQLGLLGIAAIRVARLKFFEQFCRLVPGAVGLGVLGLGIELAG